MQEARGKKQEVRGKKLNLVPCSLSLVFDIAQTSVRWSAADVRAIKKAVQAALEHQLGILQNRFSISITLTTDRKIQKINSEWRGKNNWKTRRSIPKNCRCRWAISYWRMKPACAKAKLTAFHLTTTSCFWRCMGRYIYWVMITKPTPSTDK